MFSLYIPFLQLIYKGKNRCFFCVNLNNKNQSKLVQVLWQQHCVPAVCAESDEYAPGALPASACLRAVPEWPELLTDGFHEWPTLLLMASMSLSVQDIVILSEVWSL